MSNLDWMKRKKEPPMPQPPTRSVVSPEVAKMLDDITRTSQERDALRNLVSQQQETMERLVRENDFLREQMRDAEYKRDFYQRLSTAILTRLEVVHSLVKEAVMEAATDAAQAPKTKSKLSDEDAARFESRLTESEADEAAANRAIHQEIDKI